eukprot:CAMPEP_0195038710 /NCGR_PEP_ID=MMETSP0326_2-20130528/78082_1 /TAXON_ID=2866 ORGANISM="Crypthecodinium cohnii, Strain Seligo" /NCGR_SAMPLE_ID=MMETSP0326_2 /ASSEMBLY_ACC=CAM_ASM_000348 /LENGTH=49 /DNA_ID= /DNA_START= /DNA_END= /DNA_ORIENTATION=
MSSSTASLRELVVEERLLARITDSFGRNFPSVETLRCSEGLSRGRRWAM